MLHDIKAEECPATVNMVARKLKDGGQIFIKEPIKESHGMPPEEIRQLMSAAGLKEISFTLKKSGLKPTYTGVFKKERKHNAKK